MEGETRAQKAFEADLEKILLEDLRKAASPEWPHPAALSVGIAIPPAGFVDFDGRVSFAGIVAMGEVLKRYFPDLKAGAT